MRTVTFRTQINEGLEMEVCRENVTGVFVSSVEKDGSAEKAGVCSGDKILKLSFVCHPYV